MYRIRAVTSPHQMTTGYGWVKGYPLNRDYPMPGKPAADYGFHTGRDYVTPDKKVLAPMDSKVVAKGYNTKDGNYLVLEAGGYRDWFSHLSAYNNVEVGQTVSRGQHVATMGDTGSADGIHLHHSLRVNGTMVDPELFITREEIEVKEDYPNKGDLYNIGHANAGWGLDKDGNVKPEYIARWTTGTGNAAWGNVHNVWTALIKEVREYAENKATAKQRISAAEVKSYLEAAGRTNIPQSEIDYYANASDGRIQLMQNLVVAYRDQQSQQYVKVGTIDGVGNVYKEGR